MHFEWSRFVQRRINSNAQSNALVTIIDDVEIVAEIQFRL